MSDHQPSDLEQRFVEHVVTPFVRDPMLWPILLVFILHAVAGLSFALVLALRERKVAAVLAVTLAILMTWNGVRVELHVRHRPAALCVILTLTWLLSAAVAMASVRYGIL